MTQTSRYMKYLPAVYQQPEISNNLAGSEAFLSHYLNIFEKIFSGIDDDVLSKQKGMGELLNTDVIGNLFYPRFSFLFPNNSDFIPSLDKTTQQTFSEYIPPLNTDPDKFSQWLSEFVNWLAGWVALPLDQSWDIDKKRQVIASIMPVYRSRGTLPGLQQLLDLSIAQGHQSLIIQRIVVQNAAKLPALQVGINFILQENYSKGGAIVSGQRPWLFIVNVYMQPEAKAEDVQAMLQKINALCDYAKPAFSYFELHLYPTVQLDVRATLGGNAILGSDSIPINF